MLNWRTITSSNNPDFLTKGTEVSVALCGAHSRFQICEIRSYDKNNNPGFSYFVRDAQTVSLKQVREGIRPAIVEKFSDLEKAILFCEKNDFAVDNNV